MTGAAQPVDIGTKLGENGTLRRTGGGGSGGIQNRNYGMSGSIAVSAFYGGNGCEGLSYSRW